MTKWERIAAARHCAWVERKTVRLYHSWLFVLLAGLCLYIILLVAFGTVPSSGSRQFVFLLLLTAGILGITLWVRKERQILISANSVPHEGQGNFVVRLLFVVNPSVGLTMIGSGSAKTNPVYWPNYCVNCDAAEGTYQRGGFEYSTFAVGRAADTISKVVTLHRGRTKYTMNVSYKVPICNECGKTYAGRSLAQLDISGGFQFFTFARLRYGLRFRQQNLGACYACSYCGAPVGDDAQTCACGKQQPVRKEELPQATGL